MSNASINFKKGDKLLCVEPNFSLTKGKIYTFDKFTNIGNEFFLRVEESDDEFYLHRFVLAIPEMNEQKLKKALGLSND